MNSKITNKNIMNYKPDNKTVNYYKKILTIMGQNNLIFMRWFNSITIQTKTLILIILISTIIIFYYLSVGLKRSNITPKEIFITEIMNKNPKPWNAMKPYIWNGPNNCKQRNNCISRSYITLKNSYLYSQGKYTISFWIFINPLYSNIKNKGWDYRLGKWKHILHRGSKLKNKGDGNWNAKFQSPGFWLSPNSNNLNCIIDTTEQKERIIIEDIKLNTWVNITAVLDNYSISLYIDGKLYRTITLRFNPLSGKSDPIYVTNGGGFSGFISMLQLYSTSLSPDKIYENYKYYLYYINKYIKYRESQKKYMIYNN
jgi:hypothetical protein